MSAAAKCAWCPRKAGHPLDGQRYCCACFDQIVEHCGNIRSIPTPSLRLSADAINDLHRLAARLHAERRAAFHAARNGDFARAKAAAAG